MPTCAFSLLGWRDVEIDATAALWARPEGHTPGRPLIVLLHGAGGTEWDLFARARLLPKRFDVVSPRATVDRPTGWAWMPVSAEGNPDPDDVDAAAAAILNWVRDIRADSSEVWLAGASQGAALALQVLRIAPGEFSGAVVLSGFLAAGADSTGDEELRAVRPRVHYSRGDTDEVVRPDAVLVLESWLRACTRPDILVFAGQGHDVTDEQFEAAAEFLDERPHGGVTPA